MKEITNVKDLVGRIVDFEYVEQGSPTKKELYRGIVVDVVSPYFYSINIYCPALKRIVRLKRTNLFLNNYMDNFTHPPNYGIIAIHDEFLL